MLNSEVDVLHLACFLLLSLPLQTMRLQIPAGWYLHLSVSRLALTSPWQKSGIVLDSRALTRRGIHYLNVNRAHYALANTAIS